MPGDWVFPLKLADLPLVLAGPILRKVTPSSVTVWFALLKPATVNLTVSDDAGPILTGARQTYAVGPNLHIVAVTAATLVPVRSGAMTSGVIYTYDASFVVGGKTVKLQDAVRTPAGDAAIISYLPSGLPSFCLPPTDRNKLRLIHGSCRHPNATGGSRGGPDALPFLDQMISETASHADLRPHQLLLTGDQIYADDVAGPLLHALTLTSKLLVGGEEVLPGHPSMPLQAVGTKLPPYGRKKMSELAGLTSDVPFSHLFSLGEYICMYLFVWSDVLWTTAKSLPDEASFRSILKLSGWHIENAAVNEYLKYEIDSVERFRSTLKSARRALANIPTYMILDDHEVTDDFNMFMQFTGGVYKSDMGVRIIQNGLTAYALCQHWGNVPEDFFDTAANPAGLQLLKLIDGKYPNAHTANSPAIMKLVGVHRFEQMAAAPSGVFSAYHDKGTLDFNYVITWPTHQIIVTDSRTYRSFPKDSPAPELLPKSEIDRQIVNVQPPTGDRILIVVLSTNAPPVPVIRFSPSHPAVAHKIAKPDPWPDLYDSWELPSAPFDRLMAAISQRLPLVTVGSKQVRTGAAIILSGDVHSSFSTRLLLQGSARFGDVTPQPVNMVVAQLVSSSLRNQTDKTISQHHDGYGYPIQFIFAPKPEGYLGWNVPAGTSKTVGQIKLHMEHSAPYNDPVIVTGPTTLPTSDFSIHDGHVTVAQDYAYRLDYLRARKERPIPEWAKAALDPLPPTASETDRKKTAERFRKITANYRAYGAADSSPRQIVGVNNIGEVTFDWAAKRVNHTIRWVGPKPGGNPGDTAVMLSTYVVSLDPADTAYKLDDVMPPVVKP